MRVWVVSEIHPGTLNQALGVAECLSEDPVVKIVRKEHTFRRLFFPFRQDRREAEPDIIVSCGRVSEYFVKNIKQTYNGRPFAVHLQRPAPETDCFDLIFVSSHEWHPEFEIDARFRSMLGVPHRIKSERIASNREAARAKWARNDERVLALLIGGPSRVFDLDDPTIDSLLRTVALLLSQGWKVLATVSRRSPAEVAEKLRGISSDRFFLWNFEGDNPYADFISAADAFLITQDSVTMLFEASVSGRPIFIFPLAVKNSFEAEKFVRLQSELLRLGIARPFRGKVGEFCYSPPDETRQISYLIKNSFLSSRRGVLFPFYDN